MVLPEFGSRPAHRAAMILQITPVRGKGRGIGAIAEGTTARPPTSATYSASPRGENRTSTGRRGPAVTTGSIPGGPRASGRTPKKGVTIKVVPSIRVTPGPGCKLGTPVAGIISPTTAT